MYRFPTWLRKLNKDHKIVLLPLKWTLPKAEEIEGSCVSRRKLVGNRQRKIWPNEQLSRGNAGIRQHLQLKEYKDSSYSIRATENLFSDTM